LPITLLEVGKPRGEEVDSLVADSTSGHGGDIVRAT
jgi:hypothetical protein